MGISNPEFYLSHEKELTVSMEPNFRASMEFQDQEEILVSALEIKLPSLVGQFKNGDEEDQEDGIRTPTSIDHKLPLIFSCPPAPRKPKPFPRKRRAGGGVVPCCCRRILISDLSYSEIEGLFAPAVVFEDLGGIIKKVKTN